MLKRKRRNFDLIIKSVVVLGIVAFIGGVTGIQHLSRNTYQVTITDKQVKRGDKSDKYLIFTQSKDGKTIVFENTDSLIEGKFDASDMYGQLKVNSKYDLQAYGWRIPFLSMYENIVKAKETN